MDHGWIATGSGTATPDLSIEVGDVDAVFEPVQAAGMEIVYGPSMNRGKFADFTRAQVD